MLVILTLLLIVSLVALVVGLIKPNILGKILGKTASRKKVGLVFGIASLVFFIAAFAITPDEDSPLETANPQQSVVVVYDVPALVGKNVDEVREVLGPPNKDDSEPTTLQLETPGFNWWSKSYIKDGYELLISYDPKNRKIIDLFIGTKEETGLTKDQAHLLAIGNLKENDLNYTIEFVKALKDPSSFTGIKVIPTR